MSSRLQERRGEPLRQAPALPGLNTTKSKSWSGSASGWPSRVCGVTAAAMIASAARNLDERVLLDANERSRPDVLAQGRHCDGQLDHEPLSLSLWSLEHPCPARLEEAPSVIGQKRTCLRRIWMVQPWLWRGHSDIVSLLGFAPGWPMVPVRGHLSDDRLTVGVLDLRRICEAAQVNHANFLDPDDACPCSPNSDRAEVAPPCALGDATI